MELQNICLKGDEAPAGVETPGADPMVKWRPLTAHHCLSPPSHLEGLAGGAGVKQKPSFSMAAGWEPLY